MNKHKEKQHPPEEAGNHVKAQNLSAGDQAAPETAPTAPRPAGEPTDAVKLAKAEQEIVDLKDQLLRLRADFDNYRKRVLRDKVEIFDNANEALMQELLPVLDHFQLALQSAGKHQADRAWREGLLLIYNQLMESLAGHGLAPFDSEKHNFDPKLHEAISSLPSATEPEGVILVQSRPGYKFKNKLLRPAQVVVSSGKAAPPQPAAKDTEQEITRESRK